MAQLDSTEFRAQTALLYADNTSGDISAADLRAQMNNIADSVSFKTVNNIDAPQASDDSANTGGRGAFRAGDIWIDETNNIGYVCVDASVNLAVWDRISPLTGTEIKALYEAQPNTNAFTDAEQTKLAGIEASATADQTGSEIKALYEAEADTNAFTDAEQTKLTGIEASATADQTGAEIKALYEAEADTNAFTDAEQTKLTSLNRFLPIENESATSYVAVAADAGKYKRMTAATAITLTINNSIFTAGDEVIIEQAGAGTITITPGAGMTINSRGGFTSTGGQYGFVTLKFISASEAVLGGDIA